MHIAFFTNTYHPVVSGVVRSVSSFREALTNLGHNVFIFAQQASDYKDPEPFIFRYPAIDLPLTHHYPLTIPLSPFIDKMLPLLKPEIIHSHHPLLLGQTAAGKAQELDVPLVFTYHTRYREYSHYISLQQDIVKEAIDRWMGDYMQKCHHIVVPSHSIKELLASTYGVTEQVTIVPTGINLEPYRQANGQSIRQKRGWGQDTVLMSIGRLAKEKNWTTLLTAVAKVSKSHQNIRLVILGSGDEQKTLKKLAVDLGIAQRVEFVGSVPFDEIPHYLKAADIFCFASVSETQGLVTMEAMAAGLPIVAVAASGTEDVVEHNRQGILTENHADALAAGLTELLANPAQQEKFKEASHQKARQFDMTVQARRMLEVYGQAIENKKARRQITVDRRKKIFQMIVDEELWNRWFGLDKREPNS